MRQSALLSSALRSVGGTWLHRTAKQIDTRPAMKLKPEPPTRSHAQVLLKDMEEEMEQQQAPSFAVVPANVPSLVVPEDDDDLVVDDFQAEAEEPTASNQAKVSPQLLDLVTDELGRLKDIELERRRAVLHDLTHPHAADYTYEGKLVPPPPLNFGKITPEARKLGQQMFVEQDYSLVQTGTTSDFYFEINDLYMEVAFVGKANAGKSSLINALSQQPMAKTSSLPNSTRTINFYQSVKEEELKRFAGRNPNRLLKLPAGGLQLTLVDVPGFGIEGMSDKWRDHAIQLTDSYIGTRRSLNTVFLCIDATRGFTEGDLRYFEWLENLHGTFFVLLTKCDLIPYKELCWRMRTIYRHMTAKRGKNSRSRAFPFILPVSSATGANIDELRALIVETSGMISGDKLRGMIKAQRDADHAAALREEEERVDDIWRQSRLEAKQQFLESRGLAPPQLDVSSATGVSDGVVTSAPVREVVLPMKSMAKEDRAWSVEGNYDTPMRVNAGMSNRPTVLNMGEQQQTNEPAEAQPSSEPQTGRVSEFLDALDTNNGPADEVRVPDAKAVPAWKKKREEKLQQKVSAARKQKNRVFMGSGDGLVELKSGKPVGPVVGGVDGYDTKHRERFDTKRYLKKLKSPNERQRPWAAVKQAVQSMSRQEMRDYARSSGRVEQSPEEFQKEVDKRAYFNESRFVETKAQQEELHVSGKNRISWKSQPTGMLRKYGERSPNFSNVVGV